MALLLGTRHAMAVFLTALYGRTNILHRLPDCICAWRDVLDLKCQSAVRKKNPAAVSATLVLLQEVTRTLTHQYNLWFASHFIVAITLKRINYWTCESSCFFSHTEHIGGPRHLEFEKLSAQLLPNTTPTTESQPGGQISSMKKDIRANIKRAW